MDKTGKEKFKNLKKKKKGKKVRGKAAFVLPLTQSEMQDVCIKRSHSWGLKNLLLHFSHETTLFLSHVPPPRSSICISPAETEQEHHIHQVSTRHHTSTMEPERIRGEIFVSAKKLIAKRDSSSSCWRRKGEPWTKRSIREEAPEGKSLGLKVISARGLFCW